MAQGELLRLRRQRRQGTHQSHPEAMDNFVRGLDACAPILAPRDPHENAPAGAEGGERNGHESLVFVFYTRAFRALHDAYPVWGVELDLERLDLACDLLGGGFPLLNLILDCLEVESLVVEGFRFLNQPLNLALKDFLVIRQDFYLSTEFDDPGRLFS